MRLEHTIIKNLIQNDQFARKVSPFIKAEYFSKNDEKTIVTGILDFISKYNALPTYESLIINFNSSDKITDNVLSDITSTLKNVCDDTSLSDQKWLLDKTEHFCQEKAVYNAIMESITILDDKSGNKSKGSIPHILSDALGVSFDTHVGHDFINDYADRYDFYHRKEEKLAFDLDFFNKITKGGVPSKTLNVILAGTGTGKSLFMCHVAASAIAQGKNALYITLEMAEERIAERIDANLLNIRIDDLEKISKDTYEKKFLELRSRVHGKLIIKEYPTASASAANFRALLDELKIKRNFRPDVIFIDYLNICASSRLKQGNNVNSYSYIKAIAEELRGLAVEFDVPIFSATQTTRSGATNTDPGLEDTSECIYVKEKVTLLDGSEKCMEDVIPGDQVVSQDEYKTVMFVHHKKPKECVKVTLKSGKNITVSKDHVFPTKGGRKCVNTGLSVGDLLSSN